MLEARFIDAKIFKVIFVSCKGRINPEGVLLLQMKKSQVIKTPKGVTSFFTQAQTYTAVFARSDRRKRRGNPKVGSVRG